MKIEFFPLANLAFFHFLKWPAVARYKKLLDKR
jgi:hypothetical protein